MIVTTQTPKYLDMSVEQAGCLLPEADVLDADGTGVKIRQDREVVKMTADSLATFPTRVYLAADDAEHLGHLLIAAAKAARAW